MSELVARRSTYAGLFMVALATLMFEILLTRIFSVTMWYHFAFFAVSIAMFGMTFGAVVVYLSPDRFTPERTPRQLALNAYLFSLTAVLGFVLHIFLPFLLPAWVIEGDWWRLTVNFVIIAVPFVFSGIAVTLALTRFPQQISRLYGADLAGAAAGCVLLIVAIDATDGPTTVLIVAALAASSAWFFAGDADARALRRTAAATVLVMTALSVGHGYLARTGQPVLRIMWAKGHIETRPLLERWNSFSRVAVFGDPDHLDQPFGWGLSETFPRDRRVRQLGVNIDADAYTVMTAWDGNPQAIEHLEYDVTNLAHHIRHDATVLAIGVGGGRDILSALAFDQRRVTGVEINGAILSALEGPFAPFTGYLGRHSRVRFVNDEARSFIARTDESFDIIQASLIDTWAATSAGAFVFTENSLYTTDAWKVFLDHLTPDGVLTFSRWYFRDRPAEIYRLVALAAVALRDRGVEDPSRHIALVRRMYGARMEGPSGIGTIIVGRSPLTAEDVRTLYEVTERLRFEVMLLPDGTPAPDPTLGQIAAARDLDRVFADYPLDITPPTDDKPFFFHMLRFRDLFRTSLWEIGIGSFNLRAISVLGILIAVVVTLSLLCIVVPVAMRSGLAALSGSSALLTFFAAIGLGFMLVEISQMQRLIVFLGHPVYGLSVLLFSLLVFSGIGSLLTAHTPAGGGTRRLGALLAVLVTFGFAAPEVASAWGGATTPVRIALSVGMLAPLGLLMGAAFPLGMQMAAQRSPALAPWLWGVNGATSVCASAIAVAISLTGGISATYWTGVACYFVAAAAFVRARG